MSWKRKSPGARRRRRLRRERRRWSYGYWLLLEQRLWRDMGLQGAQLQRAARLAARYVVGGGSGNAGKVCAMAEAHAAAIALRWRQSVEVDHNLARSTARWSARITF